MLVMETGSHFLKHHLPEGFSLYDEGYYPSIRVVGKNTLLSAMVVEEELRLNGFPSSMVEVVAIVEDEIGEIRFTFDFLFFTEDQIKNCLNLIARTIYAFEKMYEK